MLNFAQILAFNDTYFPGWRDDELVYLTNALAGETGEVCELVKHRAGGGTKKREVTDAEIVEELADVFIYLTLISESLGHDERAFEEAVMSKMKKNEARMKYWNGGEGEWNHD